MYSYGGFPKSDMVISPDLVLSDITHIVKYMINSCIFVGIVVAYSNNSEITVTVIFTLFSCCYMKPRA